MLFNIAGSLQQHPTHNVGNQAGQSHPRNPEGDGGIYVYRGLANRQRSNRDPTSLRTRLVEDNIQRVYSKA